MQLLQPLGQNQLAADPGKVLNALSKQEEFRFHSRVILHDSEAVLCPKVFSFSFCLISPSPISSTCGNQAERLALRRGLRASSSRSLLPQRAPPHPAFENTRNRGDAFDNASLEVASEWRNVDQRLSNHPVIRCRSNVPITPSMEIR
jgi:hypothetical protein